MSQFLKDRKGLFICLTVRQMSERNLGGSARRSMEACGWYVLGGFWGSMAGQVACLPALSLGCLWKVMGEPLGWCKHPICILW